MYFRERAYLFLHLHDVFHEADSGHFALGEVDVHYSDQRLLYDVRNR